MSVLFLKRELEFVNKIVTSSLYFPSMRLLYSQWIILINPGFTSKLDSNMPMFFESIFRVSKLIIGNTSNTHLKRYIYIFLSTRQFLYTFGNEM